MPLKKTISIAKIDVSNIGVVTVDMEIRVTENGISAKEVLHSFEIAPGDDYSTQPAEVQSACMSAHTPDVINAYRLSIS
jgi:hypothetical protein